MNTLQLRQLLHPKKITLPTLREYRVHYTCPATGEPRIATISAFRYIDVRHAFYLKYKHDQITKIY